MTRDLTIRRARQKFPCTRQKHPRELEASAARLRLRWCRRLRGKNQQVYSVLFRDSLRQASLRKRYSLFPGQESPLDRDLKLLSWIFKTQMQWIEKRRAPRKRRMLQPSMDLGGASSPTGIQAPSCLRLDATEPILSDRTPTGKDREERNKI